MVGGVGTALGSPANANAKKRPRALVPGISCSLKPPPALTSHAQLTELSKVLSAGASPAGLSQAVHAALATQKPPKKKLKGPVVGGGAPAPAPVSPALKKEAGGDAKKKKVPAKEAGEGLEERDDKGSDASASIAGPASVSASSTPAKSEKDVSGPGLAAEPQRLLEKQDKPVSAGFLSTAALQARVNQLPPQINTTIPSTGMGAASASVALQHLVSPLAFNLDPQAGSLLANFMNKDALLHNANAVAFLNLLPALGVPPPVAVPAPSLSLSAPPTTAQVARPRPNNTFSREAVLAQALAEAGSGAAHLPSGNGMSLQPSGALNMNPFLFNVASAAEPRAEDVEKV